MFIGFYLYKGLEVKFKVVNKYYDQALTNEKKGQLPRLKSLPTG